MRVPLVNLVSSPTVRTSLVVCCAAWLVSIDGAADEPSSGTQFIHALETWSESAVVPHQANRHLEVQKIGADERAWMDAATTIDPQRGFSFNIEAQGGPGRLRRRMLDLLKEEARAWATRDPMRSAFSTKNYTLSLFQTRPYEVDVRLVPRRAETYLVDGRATLNRANGEILRVEGTLAKTPSFWLRDVALVRTYTRIGNHVMLSDLQSIAKVRWWGNYRLTMTYSYSVIDGVRVANSEQLSAVGD
ncbi:MAG: hypothetical protein AB7I50_06420 [Vicinamibacterales bacterium]